jgi:transposase-like protein
MVKWFWMIFMMTRQKSGVSMQGLQRMLGIPSYQTVWTMGHKIRKAMADRDAPYQLAGLVEMDDTYLGPRKPGVRGRGARGKAKIVIGVESHEDHPGFAVMKHVPSVNPEQVLGISQDKVAPQTTLRTDGWFAYRALATHGYIHEPHVISKDKESLKKLRWVHVLAANLKGNIRGVYHGVSQKHLDRYLAEFSYRFNRRHWDPQLFNRAVVACVSTSTVTFAELSG